MVVLIHRRVFRHCGWIEHHSLPLRRVDKSQAFRFRLDCVVGWFMYDRGEREPLGDEREAFGGDSSKWIMAETELIQMLMV